ncbi:5376_t:CDS:2, partial [Funneliformis geosporum]
LVSNDINQKNMLRIKSVESSKIDHKVLFYKTSADIISEQIKAESTSFYTFYSQFHDKKSPINASYN